MHPDHVAPLGVWLGSSESAGFTGRLFELAGGLIRVAQGWMRGPEFDNGERWEAAQIGPVIRSLLEAAADLLPDATGGALLLGVDGVCVISHGSSSAAAIVNAVRVAAACVRGDVVANLRGVRVDAG